MSDPKDKKQNKNKNSNDKTGFVEKRDGTIRFKPTTAPAPPPPSEGESDNSGDN